MTVKYWSNTGQILAKQVLVKEVSLRAPRYLVPECVYDVAPRYLIVGGVVFVPLTLQV